jgi:phosphoglycerate dehydrogenase-like enzyme
MRLLLSARMWNEAGADIRSRFPQIIPVLMDEEGRFLLNEKPLAPLDVQAEIAWGSGEVLVSPHIRSFMDAALQSRNLKWFQSAAAGYDHPVFRMVAEKGILVTSSHANAVAIAEYVLASVFALFHDVVARWQVQQGRRWERNMFCEIFGTNWLIVGYGHIGSALGVRLKALGARVAGIRRSPTGTEAGADEVHRPDRLHALLPNADVVVLSAPAGAETESLADANFFAAMKEGAIFVNVARGSLVDETALLQALDRGRPAWAQLDVMREEPLTPPSPLWRHPRIRLTSHLAGGGNQTLLRNRAEFLDNLARFLDGRPLVNPVPLSAIPEKSLVLGV